MIKKVTIIEATCDLCGKTWRPRTNKPPRYCVACGSTRWNEGRKRPPIKDQRQKANLPQ